MGNGIVMKPARKVALLSCDSIKAKMGKVVKLPRAIMKLPRAKPDCYSLHRSSLWMKVLLYS